MKQSLSMMLLSVVIIVVLTTGTDGHLGCYGLHAVFTFRDTQFFVYGKHQFMVGINYRGEVVYTGHITHTGSNYPVSAAVGIRDEDMFYLQSGKYETGFNEFNNESINQPLYWSGAGEKLAENPKYRGIDAAFAKPNSTIVYFAGCEYAEVDAYHMSYIGKGSVKDLDLPCDVDAAWSSPNLQIAYITKGVDLWRWFLGEDRVEGPIHLFSIFFPLAPFMCPA